MLLTGICFPGIFGGFAYAQSTAPVVKGQKSPTSAAGVEVVYVTQHHGAVPKTIKRAPGPFLLIVVNRTTRPSLTMSVIPVATSAAAAASGVLNDKSLQLVLDLPRGSYSITEASRADWAVDLEIQ